MNNRKQKIAQGLEDARVASEARANAEQEAAKILAEAQNKANQVVRESTDRAEAAALEIRAAAEAEATKEREAALAEVEAERDRMLGDLRSQIAALAIAAAQKLVGESLDEKRQHALINEFFSGVRAGKVEVLEGATISGASAEVTSALPFHLTRWLQLRVTSYQKSAARQPFRSVSIRTSWVGWSSVWEVKF